ncbi:hypothetical protein, partial [Klebsiella pneumoniae]|uniref:hypothetical protein n=1 Tax=Klebsiella pneumoniae TaxID=573 RepID=UPI0022306852
MLKGDEHNTHAGLTPAFHSPGPGWGTPQKFFADKKGCCVPGWRRSFQKYRPRFYVSTSKSIIKALINMHSFEIQL